MDSSVLRQSEARWRSVVDSAVDGIIVIDHRGLIESFNPGAERLFGYAAGEVIGRSVTLLMPEPDRSRHDGYLQRYLETGQPHIIGIGREVVAVRRDGRTFPAHLSVGDFTLDGETKFTGIIRDLTERAALEARVREDAGLARIGELAAVLAHEVKNPLAAIGGAIEVLSDRLPTDADRAIVQEILQRIASLSELMNDLLLYARPPRLQPGRVHLSELLINLTAFFRSDPAWRAVDVAITGRARPVDADADLLRIALQNLLLNAMQAMPQGGPLVVRVHEAEGLVHIDVIDRGPGISPDVRDRLFTPFFTTKARGTGLGLATARRIAEAHGGRADVIESSHSGTTVRLTLPASPMRGS